MTNAFKKGALLTLLAGFMLASSPAQAGVGSVVMSTKSGIKAGASLSVAKPSWSDAAPAGVGTMKYNLGYHAGITTRLSFLMGMIYVQPELLYNRSSFDVNSTAGATTVYGNLLDVPLAFGVKLGLTRFYAGPVFNIYSSTSTSNKNIFSDAQITYPAVGYQAGVGLSLLFLDIDLKLNGLGAAPQETFITGATSTKADLSKYNLMLSVGVMF